MALACTPARSTEPLEPFPRAPGLTPPVQGARLPRTFIPIRYAARLAVDDSGALVGTMTITGDVAKASDVIWLHGAELQIDSATATRGATTISLEARDVRRSDGPGLFLALVADRPLAAGRWIVTIGYRATVDDKGPMPDDLESREKLRVRGRAAGAFREWVDGQPYLFTMAEPMDARRIFPCVDEPDLKVPWQLTLDVRDTYVAVSNTPIVKETPVTGGRKQVEFAPTLPLASYLIAFAVGPFDVTDAGVSKSGIPIRILTQRGESVLASWAATATAPILDAAEAWFEIPLAFRKLDLVAVPVTGPRWVAMENPGVVTFLSSTLRDATDDAHGDTWRFVVTHEVVHQWFGNLVTPAWWNDIWLNESFAVWLTAKLTVQLSPHADPSYGTLRVGELTSDTGGTEAPTVRIPASELDDAYAMARYFSGNRGAHVLAMLEAFVGPAVFQSAVRAYVRAHAYGTATTADLIAALDTAAGASFAAILGNYLDQPSAPSLTIALHCERDRSRIEITRPSSTWNVPVCVAYDRDGKRADHCLVVDEPIEQVVLQTGTCPRWVLPNAGGRGLYATQWAPGIVDGLLGPGWSQLSPIERTEVLREITSTLDPLRRISLVSTLLASPVADPIALAWGAAMLRPYVRMVPPESRLALLRWVIARYSVLARKTGFAVDPDATPTVEQQRIDVLELLAAVRDRELGRVAIPLVREGAAVPYSFRGPMFELAAGLDFSIADRAMMEIPHETDTAKRWERLTHLSRLENIATVIGNQRAAFSKLHAIEQRQLLGFACTLPDRDARIALVNQLVEVRARVGMIEHITVASDRCIAERARLEPAFRAWLGPKKR